MKKNSILFRLKGIGIKLSYWHGFSPKSVEGCGKTPPLFALPNIENSIFRRMHLYLTLKSEINSDDRKLGKMVTINNFTFDIRERTSSDNFAI